MTYPPDDGSFPGPPGGEPFPGRPGQPHPGSPPQPGFPGQPHPGPGSTGGFSGRPGQPPGGRPPHAPGRSHVPPAQPGYGAHGGTPPLPPVPGHPGQPGPRRRPRGGLVVGGAAAAVLLAASLGVVVWNIADGRPYAELPGCGRLLPAEVVDSVPGTESPRAEGEYTTVDGDETAYLAEEGVLGYLDCSVGNVDGYPVHVTASLFEYEDGGEAVEKLHGEFEDQLRDRERGRHEEERDQTAVVLDWRPVSAGDTGYAVLFEGDEYSDGDAYGAVVFVTVNVGVTVSYTVGGDDGVGEAEALDFLADFAGRVERQLSREGERA
ncbi:hypothetical protein [Nocardiopsis dassonvillei]|uniref:hypothetical protein n=1 Tax=Nocardiopsis dassonvillei TaxID=2014 RepID=UPI003632CBDF